MLAFIRHISVYRLERNVLYSHFVSSCEDVQTRLVSLLNLLATS